MRREHILQQGGSILPAGYTQLEYIESTGTQWIEIPNYYPSTSSTVTGKFKRTSGNYTVVFQCGKDSSRIMMLPSNDTKIDYCFGSGYKSVNVQSGDNSAGVWYEFEMDYQYYKVNGHSYNIQGTANIIPYINLHLFSTFFGDNDFNVRPNALAYISFEDPKSHDVGLYAALRNQDSKPGLYDIVNDVFYTNNGTGEFLYA